ncbi:hypothetical protein [Aquisalinus flavus]|uniref:Secreted protein n=1 Tax=Aquisalinus flavus TaxID=1526572 RepID=A0A8J2Y7W2_9PROT|nr:hypothetical protein [Aquisalinus flavus]MBD0426454.1 hypothetical protein [Aquisalinus flavus]UNE47992.1 hypothetical protein FF099_07990 [Aquisalinus flavus]GGD07782.1 hypothetical protein GCM10011342_15820 [Aquisalinus flavus]
MVKTAAFFRFLSIVMFGALTLSATPSPRAEVGEPAEFVVNSGDFLCGENTRLASVDFAQANKTALCNGLEDWGTARLAGQASITGPGNKCVIRENDPRRLLKSVCVPKTDSAAIRGILLFGGFRTQQELNTASPEGWREALSVELANRLAEPITTFQSLSEKELSAAGGMLVLIQSSALFDAESISRLSLPELRLEAMTLLTTQTGIPLADLKEMSDEQLFELIWKG